MTGHEILINAIIKGLPYSDQVEIVSLGEIDAVRFKWRDDTYRAYLSGGAPRVMTVDGPMLVGDAKAILMSHCLSVAWTAADMPMVGDA